MPHDLPDHHHGAQDAQPSASGAPAHSHLPSDPALRVKTLETILVQKGLIDPAAIDTLIETYSSRVGPQNGAKVVARAWSEPAFRAALLTDATPLLADMGLIGRQGEHVVVVENTPQVHNMVVCTLCSCYPWSLLGIPPTWYKSDAYRARAVRDPRGVLAEFGLSLPEGQSVRVWDSTAEMRYLVLPMRPEASAGLDEAALAAWVTRNSMIGTGLPAAPEGAT